MKSTMILTVGISGSGKSTWAHKQWANDPSGTVIVNRDKIRELLFGFNESNIENYYKRKDVYELEKQITRYEDTLINDALSDHKNIIVDSTHLKRAYIERFKYWNVETVRKFFDITLEEALLRDSRRLRRVGEDILTRQYNQYNDLLKSLAADPIFFIPVSLALDESLPPCIIFDIDGTLAHNIGRSPYDWEKVDEDVFDNSTTTVLDWINSIEESRRPRIIICTGRAKRAEAKTKEWLIDNEIGYDDFYIRSEGDYRPDWVVKEEMWRDISIKYDIIGMFDDRLQVVRRARSLGLKVFNVAHNNF